MPAERRKTTKSATSDQESPPALSPQYNPSAVMSFSDTSEFEHFVRQTLTEIQAGQADLRIHIRKMEDNITNAIEFQSKRIDALESRIKDLDRLSASVANDDTIMTDHAAQLNKRFSRRNNLQIIGFPQYDGEDCSALSQDLFREKFSMPDAKIERAHRDGPKRIGCSVGKSITLATREVWMAMSPNRTKPPENPLERVVVHNTTGPPCNDSETCASVARGIQDVYMDGNLRLPIGGDFKVYEGTGWTEQVCRY